MLISVRAWERLNAKQKEILTTTLQELEYTDYYKAGIDAMKKDLDTWRATNGPDSVLTLDQQDLMKRMLPLNQKLANDVYGPGSWEAVQGS